MIERNGDVFTTKATYIGHGVNCRGVMGAGIAKTIRDRYPQVYLEYQKVCDSGAGFVPGNFFVYPENGKVIVNFATQDMPGPDATYDAVFCSLYRFAEVASNPKKLAKYGNVVAIPEIGCGIGGLEWPIVKMLIEAVEEIHPDIVFEVWHYV
jgi:O-acetyl-ADP-ribose deacetylase (regulator of RNase III)